MDTRRPAENQRNPLEDRVYRRLQQSLKYRHLCDATLRRLAREASKRFRAEKDALLWAKKKLHQSFGAFMTEGSYRRIDLLVGRISECRSMEERKKLCRQVLGHHLSTRERLPLLQELYPKLLGLVGKPAKIVDLACGLHPFALPWMGLGADAEYLALDSDCRLMSSLSAFFSACELKATARCDDLFSFAPEGEVSLILLLKTLPCLERQRRGAGMEIIRKWKSRYLLISFPTRTLGGRRKGLPESYRSYAEGIVEELMVPVNRFAYPSELFYLFDLG
jgi:16S rRNA (guanine(1405)-N(7))-methyltransferase